MGTTVAQDGGLAWAEVKGFQRESQLPNLSPLPACVLGWEGTLHPAATAPWLPPPSHAALSPPFQNPAYTGGAGQGLCTEGLRCSLQGSLR